MRSYDHLGHDSMFSSLLSTFLLSLVFMSFASLEVMGEFLFFAALVSFPLR